MRTEEEVRAMLNRFNRALSYLEEFGEDRDDTAIDGIYDALLWVLGGSDMLKEYLPKETRRQ